MISRGLAVLLDVNVGGHRFFRWEVVVGSQLLRLKYALAVSRAVGLQVAPYHRYVADVMRVWTWIITAIVHS